MTTFRCDWLRAAYKLHEESVTMRRAGALPQCVTNFLSAFSCEIVTSVFQSRWKVAGDGSIKYSCGASGLRFVSDGGGIVRLSPAVAARQLGKCAESQSCLANLSRISLAFVQYAEDYDGKFPRGVDPEDRNDPRGWAFNEVASPDGRGRRIVDYSNDARTAPMLHDLLSPYTRDRTVWRCPADIGWSTRTRDENAMGGVWGRLRNVRPSSYARFGTSYYYYTERGFSGWRPEICWNRASRFRLFDGDAWHISDGQPTITRCSPTVPLQICD
jgi:hypothetical protein